jgi:integrase
MARLRLYPRGKTWWVSGTIDGIRYRESTGHTAKAKAEQWAARREIELDTETVFGPASILTFGAAVNAYVEAGKDQRFLLPLVEEWGRKLVKDIHPGDVIDLANRLYPHAGAATKNRQVITPVVAIIRHAAYRGKAAPILVQRFETKRIITRKTATWEWMAQFAASAKPKLVALALFLAGTAARIGDALSLEWSDVDLDAGTALLRDTKNGEDRLVTRLPLVREAWRGLPRRVGQKHVFQFYDKSDVARQLKTACRKAGIEYIPTHGIGRRLFATTMNKKGTDHKTAATAGGWKSVRMYIEIYAQAGDAAEAVSDAIGTSMTQAVKLQVKKL